MDFCLGHVLRHGIFPLNGLVVCKSDRPWSHHSFLPHHLFLRLPPPRYTNKPLQPRKQNESLALCQCRMLWLSKLMQHDQQVLLSTKQTFLISVQNRMMDKNNNLSFACNQHPVSSKTRSGRTSCGRFKAILAMVIIIASRLP